MRVPSARRLRDTIAAATLPALMAMSSLPAHASAGGGSMPYSSWLQTLKASLQGEVAQIICIAIIVGSVGGWIASNQMEGLLQTLVRIGVGMGIILGTTALITSLSTSGALV